MSVSVRARRASAAAALFALLLLAVTSALPAGTPGAPVDALAARRTHDDRRRALRRRSGDAQGPRRR